MPIYVDDDGTLRMSDPNQQPHMTLWEQQQSAVCDSLSEHNTQPVAGQSPWKDFAVISRLPGDPETAKYKCYALTGSHEYKWSRKEIFEKAKAQNYWPYVVVD